MRVPFPGAPAALVCLGLAACTIPGIPHTETLSRDPVTVAGQSCERVVTQTATATVNGMHRVIDDVIRCRGESHSCESAPGDACIAAVAQAIEARRAM